MLYPVNKLIILYNKLVSRPNYIELLEENIDFIRDPEHDAPLNIIFNIVGCSNRDAYVLAGIDDSVIPYSEEGISRIIDLIDKIGLSDSGVEYYILHSIKLLGGDRKQLGVALFNKLSSMKSEFTSTVPDTIFEIIAKHGTSVMVTYFMLSDKISYTIMHKMQLLAMDNNNKKMAKELRMFIDGYFY